MALSWLDVIHSGAGQSGGGGSDITVEPLSVTENGTYTEEGKAYSPVTVNVSGADLSTVQVFIANFWLDEINLVNGSIDPQAQYICTV